jgi:hypothetical protein
MCKQKKKKGEEGRKEGRGSKKEMYCNQKEKQTGYPTS